MSAVRRGLESLIPALRRFARALSRDAETADDDAPLVERYNALGQLTGVDTPDGSGAVAATR